VHLSQKIFALCCGLSIAGLSCAATSDTIKRKEAVLLNADRSDIREAIRIFVRKDAGRFVIADPDSLSHGPNLVVHRRARDYEYRSHTLPSANLKYRLISDGTQCWLMRHESEPDSPIAAQILLPESARCAVISENNN